MPDGDAIVASWGTDWRAALPVRSSTELAALYAEARRAVTVLQESARTDGRVGQALHRKGIFESAHAGLEISAAVPEILQIGPFTPGAVWPVSVRFSSSFALAQSDEVPDQRGLGVRLGDGERRVDLLATTGEAHHARDARAMLASLGATATAARGGVVGRIGAAVVLVRALGVRDGLRMVRTVLNAAQAGVSLAALPFYSRAPFQLGPFAVRYRFSPSGGVHAGVRGTGPDALALDLRQRLDEKPLSWSFDLQGYLDPHSTPMDDHRVAWRSAWLPVASLSLRGPDPSPTSLALSATPSWSGASGAVLEPLGDLNLLRAVAYEVSQAGRSLTSRS